MWNWTSTRRYLFTVITLVAMVVGPFVMYENTYLLKGGWLLTIGIVWIGIVFALWVCTLYCFYVDTDPYKVDDRVTNLLVKELTPDEDYHEKKRKSNNREGR
jgi:hypothetical protein